MKIIHTGDLHLGSQMNSRFGDLSITEKLKKDLVGSFSDLLDYAVREGINVVMLSGDVFDRSNIGKEDKRTFLDMAASHPGIDFLYLRGNHDKNVTLEGFPSNVKLFSEDEWTSYEYEGIVITGREPRKGGGLIAEAYGELNLDAKRVNIVMLHGDVAKADVINLPALRGRGIDYLALADIHKISGGEIDSRGMWQYCGCLMGRGFDETGEHGFFVYDTDEKTSSFVPILRNVIEETNVCVTGVASPYDAAKKVKSVVRFDPKRIYRIILSGEVEEGVDTDRLAGRVEELLRGEKLCLFVSVKNEALTKIDLAKYENDKTLRGRFIKIVLQSPEYTDEEKNRIIAYAFSALGGRS
ncbi:MAG: metallophosphoesterase [Clostridia bacterium]|nr:metallophosphoesterase [Clostridia bacterium]